MYIFKNPGLGGEVVGHVRDFQRHFEKQTKSYNAIFIYSKMVLIYLLIRLQQSDSGEFRTNSKTEKILIHCLF